MEVSTELSCIQWCFCCLPQDGLSMVESEISWIQLHNPHLLAWWVSDHAFWRNQIWEGAYEPLWFSFRTQHAYLQTDLCDFCCENHAHNITHIIGYQSVNAWFTSWCSCFTVYGGAADQYLPCWLVVTWRCQQWSKRTATSLHRWGLKANVSDSQCESIHDVSIC